MAKKKRVTDLKLSAEMYAHLFRFEENVIRFWNFGRVTSDSAIQYVERVVH